QVFSGTVTFRAAVIPTQGTKLGTTIPIAVELEYQACNESQCLTPATIAKSVEVSTLTASSRSRATDGATAALAQPSNLFQRYGYVLGFVIVFLAGLALNLTPCVYPLSGVTIAYFGHQGGGTRSVATRATIYVVGIALMFSGVGVAVALSGGIFGAALQKPI